MTLPTQPSRRAVLTAAGAGLAATALGGRALAQAAKPATLLNVSYDPTRELYQDVNKAFIAFWKQRAGQDLKIQQSHNGSGASARAVISASVVGYAMPAESPPMMRAPISTPAVGAHAARQAAGIASAVPAISNSLRP